VGDEIFRTCPDRSWGTLSLLYNGYRVFTGGKAAGAWRWPHTPSSAEIKERVELYLHSPSGSSWPVLGWPLPLYVMYVSIPLYLSICLRFVLSSSVCLCFVPTALCHHLTPNTGPHSSAVPRRNSRSGRVFLGCAHGRWKEGNVLTFCSLSVSVCGMDFVEWLAVCALLLRTRANRRKRFWVCPLVSQRLLKGQFHKLYEDLRIHPPKNSLDIERLAAVSTSFYPWLDPKLHKKILWWAHLCHQKRDWP